MLGRGNGTASWIGNVNFRTIVWKHRSVYQSAGRFDKMVIAKKVYDTLQGLDPPARFLGMNNRGTYSEITYDRALEKICQALREKNMKAPIGADDSDEDDEELYFDDDTMRWTYRNATIRILDARQGSGRSDGPMCSA